jgi:acetyl-CoA carboxylase carboxyltransferase component
MGGTQAANVLLTVRRDGLQARGKDMTVDEQHHFMQPILEKYEAEGNPYYSSARLWDDGILDPIDTRMALALGLSMTANAPIEPTKYGVFRM